MNVELLEEYQRLCAIKHSLTTKVAEQERSKESLSEELQVMKKEVEKRREKLQSLKFEAEALHASPPRSKLRTSVATQMGHLLTEGTQCMCVEALEAATQHILEDSNDEVTSISLHIDSVVPSLVQSPIATRSPTTTHYPPVESQDPYLAPEENLSFRHGAALLSPAPALSEAPAHHLGGDVVPVIDYSSLPSQSRPHTTRYDSAIPRLRLHSTSCMGSVTRAPRTAFSMASLIKLVTERDSAFQPAWQWLRESIGAQMLSDKPVPDGPATLASLRCLLKVGPRPSQWQCAFTKPARLGEAKALVVKCFAWVHSSDVVQFIHLPEAYEILKNVVVLQWVMKQID